MPSDEQPVARAGEFDDGDLKQVTVGDTEILLARIDGAFHATAAHCTHYGAPLAEGALCGHRLVCPWHHACFDLTTGDHLEPPGLDGLPTFPVRRDGDQVYVRVPEDPPDREPPALNRRDDAGDADERVFAVVGGGAAGAYAVEALREAAFTGRIVMITREESGPYDRVNCSKEYLQGEAEEAWMPLRSGDFYDEHDVEVWTEREVVRLDTDAHTVHFAGDDGALHYDRALLCTGGVPRTLDVPGAKRDNVRTLRSLRDSRRLREAGERADRVVIVGASFIGLESAWSFSKLGCDVIVVAPEDVPFGPLWGERVGRMIRALHEENGVRFQLGETVEHIEGDQKEDRAERVVLASGEALNADLVLVGVGVQPATSFVEGVNRQKDGGFTVNERFEVDDDLYAAGDVAHFPYDGRRARIEHWRVACQHGRLAGYNMAGREAPYRSAPFFWSAQHGLGFYYVGHIDHVDRIIYDGEVEEHEFIAYYVEDGEARAALGVNRNTEMAAIQELVRRGRMPSPEELKTGVDVLALL